MKHCECGRFKIGSEYTVDQCRRCWKQCHDPRFQDDPTPLEDIPIKIVSLPHRQDRRDILLADIERAEVPNPTEVVPAVNGKLFDLPPKWELAGPGAYGCHLSHCRILIDAIQANQTVWIWEDDAVLCPDFWPKMVGLWSKLPRGWQGLYVGGKHFKTPLPTGIPGLVRAVNIHLTHCYLVKPTMARKLMLAYDSTNDHIDKTAHAAQQELATFAPTPFLVGQRSSFSDIAEIDYPQDRWWT